MEASDAAAVLRSPLGGRYVLHEPLGSGATGTVFRGSDRASGGSDVAIKVIDLARVEQPDEFVLQFTRDSRALIGLSHPNVVRTLDFGSSGKICWLVMEYYRSFNLRRYMAEHGRLDLKLAVKVASEVARALEYVHDCGITHRDVNPNNILLRVEDGTPSVVLVDFAVVALDDVLTTAAEQQTLVGTAQYVAPEQAGAMDVVIDGRADLYSLGATFYELVTGKVPFTASTLGELLHKQVAERPNPPSALRPELPSHLDAISLRLLAKDRDERYQSASGLIHDLDHALRRLDLKDSSSPFTLGESDFRRDLTVLTELFGREREQQALRQRLNAAAGGQGGTCVLLGAAGVGKTALARDLAQNLTQMKARAVVVRCGAGGSLAPLRVALSTLFRKLLANPTVENQRVIARLKSALGDLGGVVVALIPEAQALFGDTRSAALANAEAERSRLMLALGRVLNALGELQHPLVLIVDDAQLADEEMIEFLRYFGGVVAQAPTLALVMLRGEEVGPEHPHGPLVRQVEAGALPGELLRLAALSDEALRALVSRLVKGHPQEIATLCDWVGRHTHGNPLFVREVLRLLIRNGAIRSAKDGWQVRADQLQQIRIPATLVEMLVSQIDGLEPDVARVVELASALGREFSGLALAQVAQLEPELLAGLAEKACREGLLERRPSGYAFSSEQVRDAAYQQVGPENRRKMHGSIARVLERHLRPDSLTELTQLAQHYRLAEEPAKAKEYALRAGEACLKAFANREAARLLESALGMGPLSPRERELLADAYVSTGQLTKAFEQLDELVKQFEAPMDRSRVLNKISYIFGKQGKFRDADRIGSEALETLGVWIPKSKVGVLFAMVGQMLLQVLFSNLPFLIPRVRRNREKWLMVGRHLLEQTFTNFMFNMNRCTFFHFSALNLLQRVGPSRELARATAEHAVVAGSIQLRSRARRFGARAVEMAKSLSDRPIEVAAAVMQSMATYYAGDFDRALRQLAAVNKLNQGVGDLYWQGLIYHHLGYIHRLRGELSQARLFMDLDQANCEFTGDRQGLGIVSYISCLLLSAQGDDKGADATSAVALTYTETDPLTHAAAHRSRGLVQLQRRDLVGAATSFERSIEIARKNSLTQEYWVEATMGRAEVEALRQLGGGPRDLKALGRFVRRAQKEAGNYPVYRPYALRVKALGCVLAGDKAGAARALDAAIADAAARKLQLELGRLYQTYADHVFEEGDLRRGHYYALAGQLYRGCNAAALVSTLPVEHQLAASVSTSDRSRSISRSVSPPGSTSSSKKFANLSVDTLAQISRQIGSLDSPEHLQQKILRSAVEVAGAQSGCVLLYDAEDTHAPDPALPRGLRRVATYVHGEERAELTLSTSLLETVLRKREPVVVGDAQEDDDPEISGARSVMLGKKRSLLCAPMLVGGRLVGLIYLENNLVSRVFSEADLEMLGILSAQAAIALENSAVLRKAQESTRNESTLRRLFQSYVPPAVVNELLKRDTASMLKGERRRVTVLFADIRGFTTFSEQMPPEQLLEMLNELFSLTTVAIHDCHGIIDKFIGDAVMALFGAPHAHGNDEVNAVTAAVRIQAEVRALNERRRASGLPQLALGIGVNTGDVVVGSIGSEQRMDFTAIGDGVNIASRVEGMCKTYAASILVTEDTRAKLGDGFLLRKLERIKLRGRNQPLRLYEVFALAADATEPMTKMIAQFELGLDALESDDLSEAAARFKAALEVRPDDVASKALLERLSAPK